jgi:hypothetical protein
MISGAALVSVLRYLFHVIAGATVWAGLSIPDSAALAYSLGYNATYMIPEAIILIAVAYYLSGVIDFSLDTPTRTAYSPRAKSSSGATLSGLIFLLGIIVDVWLIAPYLQDAESGKLKTTVYALREGETEFREVTSFLYDVPPMSMVVDGDVFYIGMGNGNAKHEKNGMLLRVKASK